MSLSCCQWKSMTTTTTKKKRENEMNGRLTLMVFIILAMVFTTGYTDPANNSGATCDYYTVTVFELEPNSHVKVKADNVTVYEAETDPYLTLNNTWHKAKRNHRLVITINGDRHVFTAKGC
jgi:hypothetical protein